MFEIRKDLHWVGIKDWELKKFHGDEFTTCLLYTSRCV